MSLPLIEKYRPTDLDSLILPDIVSNQFMNYVEKKNPPNLIITGNSGTGKTSAMLCLAKKLLGDKLNDAFKELNASDERGIKNVSSNVTQFCKKYINNIQCKKIILFDESDNMTIKQQQLISIILNEYEHSTTFFFTCNSSSQIIEQIQSKCTIIRFTKIPNEKMQQRLSEICVKEKIEYDNIGISSIVSISNGDLRRALNNLHSVYFNKRVINKKNVYETCDFPEPQLLCKLLNLFQQKKFNETIEHTHYILNLGHSINDIIQGLVICLKSDEILNDEKIVLTERKKNIILNEVIHTKTILTLGTQSNVQLYACYSRIFKKIDQ